MPEQERPVPDGPATEAEARVDSDGRGRAGSVPGRRLDAEADDAASAALLDLLGEHRHGGVIGVEHERGRAPRAGEHSPPPLGDGVDLAVAVELVPEEVEEHDHAGGEARREQGEHGLVDLEDADAGGAVDPAGPASLRDERGDEPPLEVRSRAVGDGGEARAPRDRRKQVRRRRLPVGAGDADHAVLKRRRRVVEETRRQQPCHEPRQRRPPAAAGAACEGAGGTAGENGGALTG